MFASLGDLLHHAVDALHPLGLADDVGEGRARAGLGTPRVGATVRVVERLHHGICEVSRVHAASSRSSAAGSFFAVIAAAARGVPIPRPAITALTVSKRM